jgi:5-methylcytosine-specific restriction endonuclease McrA
MKSPPTYKPRWMPSAKEVKADRDSQYDRTRRDREAKAFYNSQAWKALAKLVLAKRPYCECEECTKAELYTPATLVHHVRELSECPELGLNEENLRSYSQRCHSREHFRRGRHQSTQG